MTIPVFLTANGQPDPVKVLVPTNFNFETLSQAVATGLDERKTALYMFHDESEEPLKPETLPKPDSSGALWLHCHPCRRIEVTVHYQSKSIEITSGPAVTVTRILNRAAKKLDIPQHEIDRYLLVLSGTEESPPANTPIGSLTSRPECDISFDLVLDPAINGAHYGA